MSKALESVIESVLVFPLGAEITRVANLPCGVTHVNFAELPIGLQDDSVQLSLEGVENSVLTRQLAVGLDVTGASQVSDLTQDIREAVLEERCCQTALATEERLLHLLLNLAPEPRPSFKLGQEPPPQQVSKQIEFLGFRNKQMEQIEERIGECRVRLRKASRRLEELRIREHQQARTVEPDELRKTVSVLLNEPTQNEKARVTLKYRIEAARWTPAYSAKLHTTSGQLEFSMRALVCQATEENWENVKLTLSTSTPSDVRECPELKSIRIGRAQHQEGGRRFRPPPLGTKELFAGYDLAQRVQSQEPVQAPSQPPASASSPAGGWPGTDKAVDVLESMPIKQMAIDADFVEGSWVDECIEEDMELDDDAAFGGGGAPAPIMARSTPMKKRKGAALVEKQREETVLTSDERLWNFGRLRLSDWSDPRRGELVYHESWQLYHETVKISHEILVSALNVSAVLASEVLEKSLPSGYSSPQTISGFDHIYETLGKVDVPAGGQFHSLPVFREYLPCRTDYVVVPRESLDVFRSASIENITCHGLCSGPVDVSLGEDFLHTTQLSQVEPSAKFELGLGVCQAIKVTRQVVFQESSSGLMSQTTSLPHEIHFQVVNHLANEATVKIRDRLPEVAEGFKNDLKVEKVDEGGWTHFQEPDTPEMASGLQTSVRVSPGESSTVSLKYTISMPSKYEIIGGNRREAQV